MPRLAARGGLQSPLVWGTHLRVHFANRLLLLAFTVVAASAHAQPEPPETIDVIGTPLGSTLDADKIAANAQTATADDIRERGALDFADFMKRDLGSVFVNEAQSNPLQPDVQYRGFVGSPLLGLPQGLAVYQDGVRVNEPFGDTVSWALIPESAIDRAYLLPGANPLFGLNALGGAIAIETKNGRDYPGARAEVHGGSFGRFGAQVETGGTHADAVSYFVTGSYLEEDGWRDFSPTEATQFFGGLGWQAGDASIDASFTYVETDLIGNGPAPEALLEIDREAIFTRPDRTQNELVLLNLTATQPVNAALELTGNLYVRDSDIATLNGDDSNFAECVNDPGFICDEGEIALDESGAPIPADDELEGATVNRTRTHQSSMGFGFQAASAADLGGRDNQLVAGVAYDRNSVDFAASTELGALDATRLAVPGGVFLGEGFTDLDADTSNLGLFVSNVLSLTDAVALTASARYNRAELTLEDQLGEELSGEHKFERFNPALGITYAVTGAVTLYAGYSEANRAPSPVELTCADEDDPCRLPNAFLSDPPLEQVVAKTFELGVRGRWNDGRWHAGLFQTMSDDDIIFISAGALTNEGFFDNVGRTRRLGLELNADGTAGERVSWSGSYTYVDATFRTAFTVPSPNNPRAVDGEIAVEVGDRLPLVPEHLLKAGLRFAATENVTIGADLYASSSMHFRGDEGNVAEEVDGYALLNLRADYRLNDSTRLFLSIDNVLHSEYETFGVFGEADDVLGDDFDEPEFLGPGAPRALWVGVQFGVRN
jgi:iron complex outermembrane receptor protein